jgi:hypothetical protein
MRFRAHLEIGGGFGMKLARIEASDKKGQPTTEMPQSNKIYFYGNATRDCHSNEFRMAADVRKAASKPHLSWT